MYSAAQKGLVQLISAPNQSWSPKADSELSTFVPNLRLMFSNVSIGWKKYSRVFFVWLCVSETRAAQLATVDSFKAFPLAYDLISRYKDLHRDLLSRSYTVLQ